MTSLRRVTGFDGGSTHMSAVRLTKKGDKYRVENFGFINSLHPLDDPNLNLTFREFCRNQKVKPVNLVAGLSGRSIMVRYLKVPVVPDWKLDMMMDFEIDEQTSKFTKDSYSDYRKVGIPGIRKYNVMMIGVSTREYVDFFLDNIPRIEAFNLNSLALHGASLLRPDIDETETVLLADIGALNTDLAIVRGREILFARNIQYGANNFDEDIVTSLNIDISQAEKLKIEKACVKSSKIMTDDSLEQQARLDESVTSSARMLYTHISSAVQYCREQIRHFEFDIDRILLTGGGSQLKGLNEFLQDRFKKPVAALDMEESLDLSDLSEEQQREFRNRLPVLSTAIGLSVAAIDRDGAVLDPMPSRVLSRRRFFKREFYLIAASVLFVVALVLWGWFIIDANRIISGDIEAKKKILKDAQDLQQSITEEEHLYAKYQAMERSLRERVYSSTDMLVIFNILQQTIPDDVWITGFSTEDIGSIVEDGKGAGKTPDPETASRGTIFVSGQVRVGQAGVSDPHQLLGDYTRRLETDFPQFRKFVPMVMEYSDNEKKDKFFYKYRIIIADKDAGKEEDDAVERQ